MKALKVVTNKFLWLKPAEDPTTFSSPTTRKLIYLFSFSALLNYVTGSQIPYSALSLSYAKTDFRVSHYKHPQTIHISITKASSCTNPRNPIHHLLRHISV